MVDAGDEPGTEPDPIFRLDNPIFSRKELLEIDHVPQEDRIVGRDEEMQWLANALNPALVGNNPRNVMIYGKTGTGKSLVAKNISKRAIREGNRQDVSIGGAYVDCGQSTTEVQALVSLGRELNHPGTDIEIPGSGLGTDTYYQRLWTILDERFDVALMILDEIDKLANDNILLQLSRAGEAGKIDSCKIGIIAISNKISYKDRLDERIKSSLQEREHIFPPYDAKQLRMIMQNRRDAFHDDVLSEDVIPLCAAFAAQEHGDARKALDILRYAGEVALDRGESEVREEHVREGRDLADVNRFHDLLKGQPTQAKIAVLALSELVTARGESKITSNDIYSRYCTIADQLDAKTISRRRILDLLDEQAFLDILGKELKGRGRAEGSTNLYYLLEEPETVRSAILQDGRFEKYEPSI
jgi:cell division control protein 6